MFKDQKIQLVVLLFIIMLPIWAHLTDLPIQLWDESRLAHNAYEMYYNHHWITTYFDGKPDMWNTKPPLLIWIQVASFHVFGINEFALRFPSALAGTLLCLFLYWFLTKKMGSNILGFVAVVVLISCSGFIKYHHSPRTGDYDSMLTLFTTAYIVFYYLFLEEEKRKYLALFFVFLTLSVLTKSITGLIFTPALLIYTIYKRKLLTVFKSPIFYLGIIGFVLLVGGYYWQREAFHPGYLQAVQVNDLWGRMSDYLDFAKAKEEPLYYYNLIINENFRFWYFIIPIGILLGFYAVEKFRDVIVYCTLLCLVFFFVISSANTVHNWYEMPIYPLLAIIVAIGIYLTGNMLANVSLWKGVLRKNALPYIFLLLPAVPAYGIIVTDSLHPDPGEWIEYDTAICRYLKDIYHDRIKLEGDLYVLTDDEYMVNIDWYVKAISREKKLKIHLVKFEQLQPNQRVIVFKNYLMQRVEQTYSNSLQERVFHDQLRIYFLQDNKVMN